MAVAQSFSVTANGSAGAITGGTALSETITLANGNVATLANTSGGNAVLMVHTSTGVFVNQVSVTGGNADLAQLSNGNIVVVSETGSDARYMIVTADAGFTVVSSTTLKNNAGTTDSNSSAAAVTALMNGGFAIVSQDTIASDEDLDLRIYNAAGTQQGLGINVAGTFDAETAPAILTLPNGNFVVAWTRTRDATSNSEIWQVIYSPTGTEVRNDAVFDASGPLNYGVSLALNGDGYVMSYQELDLGGLTVRTARFDAAGNYLSDAGFGATPGMTEGEVEVAALPDDLVAVAYAAGPSSSRDIALKIFDPLDVANTINISGPDLTEGVVSDNLTDASVAYLGSSLIRLNYTDDGSNTIVSGRYLITRTYTSNGASDLMLGGELREVFNGNGGSDTVDYTGSLASVVINLTSDTASGGYANGDSLNSIENLIGSAYADVLTGSSGANRLYGGAGADVLVGGAGADVLDGGTGADTMAGGLGNDFYFVDTTGDVVTGEVAYSAGGGIDTVRAFIDYVQPNNIELVRLGYLADTNNLNATGNDAPGTLVGNAGNNVLIGRGGNDQLNGNGGNDTIIGNTGRDTVVGGAGADTFIYSSISESRAGSANRDVVNGFTHGVDRIDLRGIDANTGSFGLDDAFHFVGSAKFTGSAGELRTQSLGGPNAVLIEGDINGDAVADFQIFVNLTTYMTGSDFLL